MRFWTSLVLVTIALATVPAVSAREPWKSEYDALSATEPGRIESGQVYRVSVSELRPTQFAVGMDEVEDRFGRLREMGKAELRRYLKNKVGSVVIGPGGQPYLVDGHHLALALARDGRAEMLVTVLDDWSRLDQQQFYERMIRRKRLWPYDQNGRGPLDPGLLPKTVGGLKNDPYRSLAYEVREHEGYGDVDVPFLEFMWANYFRARIPESQVRYHFDEALREALELAHEREAAKLPGYTRAKKRGCESYLTDRE